MEKLQIKIKTLKEKRNRLFMRLEKMHTLSRNVDNEGTKEEFLASESFFQNTYDQLEIIQDQIVELTAYPELESENDSLQIAGKVDDLYVNILATFAKCKINFSSDVKLNVSTVNERSNIRLPAVQIPKFDGNIKNWNQFYSLFNSLVHTNASYSDVEKMHYLVTSIQGHALSLIKSLPIIGENYTVAYQTLVKFYQNSRVLFNHYADQILNYKSHQTASVSGLCNLISIFKENIEALKAQNIDNLFDKFLAQILLKHVDSDMKKQFELSVANDEIPKVTDVLSHLDKSLRFLQLNAGTVKPTKAHTLFSSEANNCQPSNKSRKSDLSCTLCSGTSHKLWNCSQFSEKSVDERREIVKKHQLCFNCLSATHRAQQCKAKSRCRSCGGRHHTVLHFDFNKSKLSDKLVPTVHHSSVTDNYVLLGTCLAQAKDSFGGYQSIRLLVDSGSQANIMTKSCAERLGLNLKRDSGKIMGLAGNSLRGNVFNARCTIRPISSKRHQNMVVDVKVMEKICSSMPSVKLLQKEVDQFSHLKLADKKFHEPGEIDFLLGGNLFGSILLGGKFTSNNTRLVGIQTIFGWIVMGSTQGVESCPPSSFLAVNDGEIDTAMKNFWEIENPPICDVIQNPEDLVCENTYLTEYYRQTDGRYVVPILLKEPHTFIKGSFDIANKRLQHLERKFSRQTEFCESYKNFIHEYETLGHMKKVKFSRDTSYFIPHHGVLKNGDINKLRVVFDASATNIKGQSLNRNLYVGPKLQEDICKLITQFRFFPYVFSADIRKMYRQIMILPKYRKYQHILWRENSASELCDFELNTITYGLTSSAYLAIRTLHQLARDEGAKFPEAAHVLCNNVYMDDILTGAYNLSDAIALRDQLINLLQAGKFELGKWASNSACILQGVQELPTDLVTLKKDDLTIKILGLQWNSTCDSFTYHVENIQIKYTKRAILSTIAKIFDPLGLLAPVIFKVKYLLQSLWKCSLDWDDEIPSELCDVWERVVREFKLLNVLHIDRYFTTTQQVDVSLVGFSDASEKGYAAMIYVVVNGEQKRIHLVIAKSKVAPTQVLTIPRLELCAAYLLCKLMNYVKDIFSKSFNINNLFYFCDSEIVLAWLNTPAYNLQTFVANRVSFIQQNSDVSNWFYVNTKDNPVDCASRGIYPSEFINNTTWFTGPNWMQLPEADWPKRNFVKLNVESVPELKPVKTNVLLVENSTCDWFSKFSSFSRLYRTTAWMLRFIKNSQSSADKRESGPLKLSEIKNAIFKIIILDQQSEFSDDISALKLDKELRNKQLCKLRPFIDESDLLRVGGRLTNAQLEFAKKYPILLSKNSHLTNLIIDYYHVNYLHVGPRTLQSILNNKYWVISSRQQIRSRLSKCIVCTKRRVTPFRPIMGDLPSVRITPSRAFSSVGIDFGGPFLVRESRRRNAKSYKAYICLFVCMTTKAVHVELVSDLTSDSFLACLTRFVSRRGFCAHIYSDNGTNFVGANKYLTGVFKELSNLYKNDAVMHYMNCNDIQWHFIPPSAPNFGGLWEAGIKSVKYHLKRIMGDTLLTFEELTTLLVRIEAILNSRPLCALSSDPSEIESLTPGHFLVGSALVGVPEYDLRDTSVNRLDRWQHIQQMNQHFWKRWSQEYLNTLQQREKWNRPSRFIQEGDLVLVQGNNTLPQQWILGRIEKTIDGKDGIARVCQVRTNSGLILRPTNKLCYLPVN